MSHARARHSASKPKPFEQDLAELAQWLEGQAATDRFDEAAAELDRRGLTA